MTITRQGWQARIRTVLGQKFMAGVFVGMVCTIMYRSLQAWSWREPSLRTECVGWNLLPFHPGWVWPYLSMFPLIGLTWLSLPSVSEVRRFARHLLGLAAVGWICFWVWPTACLRPVLADAPLAYRWLVALDQPTNCFPCLHSALSLFAASVLALGGGRWWQLVLSIWVALLVVSIVALRQHTDWDTGIGVFLGLAAAWSFRRQRSTADERLGGRAMTGEEA